MTIRIEYFRFLVEGDVLSAVRDELSKVRSEMGAIPSIEALFFEYFPKIDYTLVELEGEYWKSRLEARDLPFLTGRDVIDIATDQNNFRNQITADDYLGVP